MKRVLTLLIMLALAACKGEDEPAKDLTPTAQMQRESSVNALVLDTFSVLPSGLDACGCFFAPDSAAFNKKEWLMAFNYDSLALIKLNGETLLLHRTATEHYADITTAASFEKDDYKLFVEITATSGRNEAQRKRGKLTLWHKNGLKAERPFFGACRCL